MDAARFERLAAQGSPREALALWRGPAQSSQPAVQGVADQRVREAQTVRSAGNLRQHVHSNGLLEHVQQLFLREPTHVLGRFADAASHYDDALQMNANMGALPWVAHTEHDYARMGWEASHP